MRRLIKYLETSQFSTHPTKRWLNGCDMFAESAIVEYPDNLDHLNDEEIMELADDEREGCRYVAYENWTDEEKAAA